MKYWCKHTNEVFDGYYAPTDGLPPKWFIDGATQMLSYDWKCADLRSIQLVYNHQECLWLKVDGSVFGIVPVIPPFENSYRKIED